MSGVRVICCQILVSTANLAMVPKCASSYCITTLQVFGFLVLKALSNSVLPVLCSTVVLSPVSTTQVDGPS